jgi:drug/metabolite transporter superfamily protein YnfA
MALLLYFLFTLVTVVGTFLIADRLHSRRLAVILALAALVFFVALFVAILALLRSAVV